MANRNTTQGRMTTQFTVWCGMVDCTEWLQLDELSRSIAAKEAKREGWDFTKSFGWRCPDCSQRARDAYAGR